MMDLPVSTVVGILLPFGIAALNGLVCFFASEIRKRYKVGIPLAVILLPALLVAISYAQAPHVADALAREKGCDPPPLFTEFSFWRPDYPTAILQWEFKYDGMGVSLPAWWPTKSKAETYAVLIHWG